MHSCNRLLYTCSITVLESYGMDSNQERIFVADATVSRLGYLYLSMYIVFYVGFEKVRETVWKFFHLGNSAFSYPLICSARDSRRRVVKNYGFANRDRTFFPRFNDIHCMQQLL